MNETRTPRRPAPLAQRLREPLERLYADFDYAGAGGAGRHPVPPSLRRPPRPRGRRPPHGMPGVRPRRPVRGGPGASAGRDRARRPRASLWPSSPAATARSSPISCTASTARGTSWPSAWPPRRSSGSTAASRPASSAATPTRAVPLAPALEAFARAFLEAELDAVFPGGRLSRGYRHLFPLPSVGGPCKRLHLFLRWMIRREPPDFGLWTARVAGAAPDARRHSRGEHEPRHRADAPALAHLEDGGGDHRAPGRHRSRRPRQVRLRPLPQADVGRLP